MKVGRKPMGPREPILCSVHGCDRPARQLTLKLCNAHYSRYRTHGDPLAGKPVRPRSSHVVHGVYATYTNLGCRCDLCRAANTAVCAKAKAKRRTREIPDHVHGTVNGRTGWGCSCALCGEAARQEYRRIQNLPGVRERRNARARERYRLKKEAGG